ncbi:MAG: ATP-binding cassette domain-containing protein [Pseudomonadota bacterium]
MGWHLGPEKRGHRITQPTWVFAFQLLGQEADTRLRALVAFALVLVLISSALTALSPVLLKLIVDHLTVGGRVDTLYKTAGFLVLAYASSQLLARSLGELRSLAVGRADQRLHRRLSSRLFKHLMALPLRFHLDRRTGALSQTLTNGLLGYRLVVQHLVSTVLPVVLELSIMSIVLLALGQPIFLGIIVSTMLCYSIAFSIGAVRLTKPSRAVSTAHIDANALLTDSILNYETIKSFCAEPHVHQRMEEAFAQTEGHWAQFFARRALNGVLVGTIFAFSLGVSVYVAASEVQQDRMSLGDFVLVHAYMLQIFRPMEMLGFAFREIAQGMAFVEKMIGLFRQEQEPATLADGKALPHGAGELVFDKVSFSYSQERQILRDVSFRIRAGTTVALVGASGSGKSTLIRLLVRFWEPENGRILLDGAPISEVSATGLRGAIAIVPQDTVLFNDSVAYNIAVGCPDSSTEEIMEAARLARIHDFIVTRPAGYETLVGERGLKLSGGEKQRIAIARAALKKPRIFVFDEATSSLDSKTEQQILSNLTEISKETTTLVIAHRLSTIVTADEILVLERGRIVERGTHRDLLRAHGAYHGMWRAQQFGDENNYVEAV